MKDSPREIIDRLYKLMIVGDSSDPDLEEEIRRLKSQVGQQELIDICEPPRPESRELKNENEGNQNFLFQMTTGRLGTIGKRIKPAFQLPKKSGFIDSTLFWFWMDAARQDFMRVERGTSQYRIRTHEQIVDVWYDGREGKGYRTEPFLTNFNKSTGILHCLICGTDAYLGRELEMKDWHHISFGELARKKGKFSHFAARPMEAAAYFNIRRLTRGDFSQCKDEAISEIETQLSFVHGRSTIHREWASFKNGGAA